MNLGRHCEERSDAAIHGHLLRRRGESPGLRRSARNDDRNAKAAKPKALERVTHQHRVVALQAGGQQGHRAFDQFVDAADILDRVSLRFRQRFAEPGRSEELRLWKMGKDGARGRI